MKTYVAILWKHMQILEKQFFNEHNKTLLLHNYIPHIQLSCNPTHVENPEENNDGQHTPSPLGERVCEWECEWVRVRVTLWVFQRGVQKSVRERESMCVKKSVCVRNILWERESECEKVRVWECVYECEWVSVSKCVREIVRMLESLCKRECVWKRVGVSEWVWCESLCVRESMVE
jgi:hypothetical protein